MTSSTWVEIGVIAAIILLTQFGRRRVNPIRMALPFIILAFVGFKYLKTIPMSGNNFPVLLISAALGIVFGLLLLTSMRVGRDENGKFFTQSGILYLIIWLIAFGIRIGFIEVAEHYPQQFYQFMTTHHLSISVIGPAFIFMTIAMFLVRIIGVLLRMRSTAVSR